MSFQAYLDNIRAETGKTPGQFKALAVKAGVYKPDMKASVLVAWLKKEFDLGHGHSMAIWAVFKDEGWVDSPKYHLGLLSVAAPVTSTLEFWLSLLGEPT